MSLRKSSSSPKDMVPGAIPFTKFSDFPTEIQDLIWEHAADLILPRVVQIEKRRHENNEDEYGSPTPCPVLMHTCQASRRVILKYWKFLSNFGPISPATIPFNNSTDTLHFSGKDNEGFRTYRPEFDHFQGIRDVSPKFFFEGGMTKDCASVTHIAIDKDLEEINKNCAMECYYHSIFLQEEQLCLCPLAWALGDIFLLEKLSNIEKVSIVIGNHLNNIVDTKGKKLSYEDKYGKNWRFMPKFLELSSQITRNSEEKDLIEEDKVLQNYAKILEKEMIDYAEEEQPGCRLPKLSPVFSRYQVVGIDVDCWGYKLN